MSNRKSNIYMVSDQQNAIFDAATKLTELIKQERGVKPSRPQAILIALNAEIERIERQARRKATTEAAK